LLAERAKELEDTIGCMVENNDLAIHADKWSVVAEKLEEALNAKEAMGNVYGEKKARFA